MDLGHGLSNSPFPNDIEEVDVEAVSNLLAREMRELSLKEQYHINQDVNGINILASTEPFELSSIGLEALEKELGTTDGEHHCYQLAEEMRSNMIKEEKFRLKFSRAERFDPVKAATRIENYLKILRQNFGDESMKRPIKLTDLDKVERDLLKSGFIQALPYRDSAGRRIIAALGNFGTCHHTLKNKIKVLMYVIQVVSEDEETQKQGCVFLFWPLDSKCTVSREVNYAVQVAPIRFSSFHFMLYDTTRFRKLGALQLLAMSRESRARSRFHFGSIQKCQQEITAYGISSNFLPITNTGNIKNLNHLKWVTFRQAQETAIEHGIEFNGIYCPSVKDVLTGKGPHVSSNPANVAYRKIMEKRFLEHRDALTAERKTMISREIVDELVQSGGRFLVREKCWWASSDRDVAREKVSVAFRDMRKTFLLLEKKKNLFATIGDNDTIYDGDEKKRKRIFEMK